MQPRGAQASDDMMLGSMLGDTDDLLDLLCRRAFGRAVAFAPVDVAVDDSPSTDPTPAAVLRAEVDTPPVIASGVRSDDEDSPAEPVASVQVAVAPDVLLCVADREEMLWTRFLDNSVPSNRQPARQSARRPRSSVRSRLSSAF